MSIILPYVPLGLLTCLQLLYGGLWQNITVIIPSLHLQKKVLDLLVGILNDEYSITVARETLRRCLYQWHILHGFVQRYNALRERDYVVNIRWYL